MAPLPLPTDSSSLQNIKKATSHLPVWAAVALVTLFVCFAHAGQTQQARAAGGFGAAGVSLRGVCGRAGYLRAERSGRGALSHRHGARRLRGRGLPPRRQRLVCHPSPGRQLQLGRCPACCGPSATERQRSSAIRSLPESGSSLSPQRSAVQVMLERGERIKLVPGRGFT